MSIVADLEYYLGYEPTADLIEDAEQWAILNPGTSLCEWVDAMAEAGLL